MVDDAKRTVTDLDLLVHRALGLEPDVVLACSRDGGQTACAWVSMGGAWKTEDELREWFHRSTWHRERGYELVEVQDCPAYSTDADEALRVLAEGRGSLYVPGSEEAYASKDQWSALVTMTNCSWLKAGDYGSDTPDEGTAWGYGDTPALAICDAVVRAAWPGGRPSPEDVIPAGPGGLK